MTKRVDHDATQEVSSSMLVSDTNPPRPVVSKNDVSMWLSQPVGADDFLAAPKRPAPAKRSINWIVPIGAVVLLALGGFGIWYGLLRESPPQMSPAPMASADPGPGAAAATGSAAVSAATPAATDAGVTAADAAAPADASGTAPADVDAISGADLAVAKVAKQRPAKNKLRKKKTAAATKKKKAATKKTATKKQRK